MSKKEDVPGELQIKMEEALKKNDFKTFAELVVTDKSLAEKYMDSILINEHFPSILNGMLDSIKAVVNSNNESMNHAHKTIKQSCEDFSKIVSEHGDKMDKAEREKIYENIMALNEKALSIDQNNKSFLLKAGGFAVGALILAGGLLINKKLDNDLAKEVFKEIAKD